MVNVMTYTTTANELANLAFTLKFAQEVNAGLSTKPKYLNPKYFYDDIGSLLFEEICCQPEYYLTNKEATILEKHSSDIVRMTRNGVRSVVELGSGSSLKTRILLKSFLDRSQEPLYYFPIDISNSILQHTVKQLSDEFPELRILGLSGEYLDGIGKANSFISSTRLAAQKIIVFLGSTIGNFEPKEAEIFLKGLADRMDRRDLLLIGFDLHKDEETLNAAYNDSGGVTAEFNLNILARINKELGGGFDLRFFTHHAFYNRDMQRIEMHLVSTRKQQVYIREISKTFDFEKDETIHTENSYKYTQEQIDALAGKSGFVLKKHFTDASNWFDLVLLERGI